MPPLYLNPFPTLFSPRQREIFNLLPTISFPLKCPSFREIMVRKKSPGGFPFRSSHVGSHFDGKQAPFSGEGMKIEAILPGNLLCFLVWDFTGWSCSFFISGDSAKEKSESISVYTRHISIVLTTQSLFT